MSSVATYSAVMLVDDHHHHDVEHTFLQTTPDFNSNIDNKLIPNTSTHQHEKEWFTHSDSSENKDFISNSGPNSVLVSQVDTVANVKRSANSTKVDFSYSRHEPIRVADIDQAIEDSFRQFPEAQKELERISQKRKAMRDALMAGGESAFSGYENSSDFYQSQQQETVEEFASSLHKPDNFADLQETYGTTPSLEEQAYLHAQLPDWLTDPSDTIAYAAQLSPEDREKLHIAITEIIANWNL
ncbi:MAG: hypothetical protein MI867_12625 [Pseudomonadales bacterium]|nr:hypothetical protein [Pseudomonadales bacterium]